MGQRKRIAFPDDPIAREHERRDREEFLAGLFHPIYGPTAEIPIEWLVRDFLPRGYLALLAADPKEGKSALATALALAIACGTPFAGMPTEQAAVLWMSLEEGPHERRFLLRQTALADQAIPFYTSFAPIPIDTEDGIDALAHWARQVGAGLIVVDPLHAAHSGRSLMDGWAARKTLKLLRLLCVQSNISALVLHHAKTKPRTHSRTVAENAQLAATASMEILLSNRPLNPVEYGGWGALSASGMRLDAGRLVTLACRGRGAFANQTVHLVSFGPLHYERLDYAPPAPRKPRARHWSQQKVLELLQTGSRHSNQLMAELNMTEPTLRSALTNLRRTKLVRIVWRRGHLRRYGLTKLGKRELAPPQSPEIAPTNEQSAQNDAASKGT